MIVLINYADDKYFRAQKFNTKTALSAGNVDRVINYSPNLIDEGFTSAFRATLEIPKGNGYWLWKPYFINKTLRNLSDGDFLIYSDSASHFIATVHPLIERMNQDGVDIMSFEWDGIEAEWTKRDAFIFMGLEGLGFEIQKQRLGSPIVIRNSQFSRDFFNECLEYACDIRIIGDGDNILGAPNHEGFKEHRHDQSIFSLMCKKYGLIGYRDPSQWGNKFFNDYPNSPYPQIMELTRQPSPKQAKLSYKIKQWLRNKFKEFI